MREILFRAKRLEIGDWVEGSLIAYPDGDCYIARPSDDPNVLDKFCVDPATVGQYTGLTDKNGKRIFEGDLLNGFTYPFLNDNAHNYFAEVVWFDNSPAFGLVTHKNPLSAVRGISDGNASYAEDFEPRDWEIIGNIHDNPELMGGGGSNEDR